MPPAPRLRRRHATTCLATLIFVLLTPVVLVVVSGSAAHAAGPPRQGLLVSAGFGYGRGEVVRSFDDGDRSTDDHGLGSYVVRVGYHVGKRWILDVGLDGWSGENGSFERQDLRLLTTSLSWHDPSGFYARLGLGASRVEVSVPVPEEIGGPGSSTQRTWVEKGPAVLGGVGLRYFLNDHLGLVGELEGAFTRTSSEQHAFYGAFNLSVQVYPW